MGVPCMMRLQILALLLVALVRSASSAQGSGLCSRILAVENKLTDIQRSQERSILELQVRFLVEMRLELKKLARLQAAANIKMRDEILTEVTRVVNNRTAAIANASRDLLSDVVDYREAKEIASLLPLGKEFTPITTWDLDALRAGQVVGYFSRRACEAHCILRSDSCHGFHSAPDRRCALFTAAATWKENETAGVEVWVRQSGGRNPRCNAANFPLSHGRSRYRVERRKMSWTAAASACASLGGKLAQISSEGERAAVHRWIRAAAGTISRRPSSQYPWRYCYHLGLHQTSRRSEPAGNWRWFPSLDRVNMTRWWHSGEPDDSRANPRHDEDHGCMLATNGRFSDLNKSNRHPSVCECFLV